MSHDFPDGPDYNPEPIDDDPWDVDTTSAPADMRWVQIEAPQGHHPRWRWVLEPIPEATEADFPHTDA